MKQNQTSLVDINQEIPSVQEIAEGKLRGGFCSTVRLTEEADSDQSANINSNAINWWPFCSCSCSCINNKCLTTTPDTTQIGGDGSGDIIHSFIV